MTIICYSFITQFPSYHSKAFRVIVGEGGGEDATSVNHWAAQWLVHATFSLIQFKSSIPLICF